MEELTKAFAQWFLDIAKYIITAILLTAMVGGIEEQWVIYAASITIALMCIALSVTLFYRYGENNETEHHKTNKRKRHGTK